MTLDRSWAVALRRAVASVFVLTLPLLAVASPAARAVGPGDGSVKELADGVWSLSGESLGLAKTVTVGLEDVNLDLDLPPQFSLVAMVADVIPAENSVATNLIITDPKGSTTPLAIDKIAPVRTELTGSGPVTIKFRAERRIPDPATCPIAVAPLRLANFRFEVRRIFADRIDLANALPSILTDAYIELPTVSSEKDLNVALQLTARLTHRYATAPPQIHLREPASEAISPGPFARRFLLDSSWDDQLSIVDGPVPAVMIGGHSGSALDTLFSPRITAVAATSLSGTSLRSDPPPTPPVAMSHTATLAALGVPIRPVSAQGSVTLALDLGPGASLSNSQTYHLLGRVSSPDDDVRVASLEIRQGAVRLARGTIGLGGVFDVQAVSGTASSAPVELVVSLPPQRTACSVSIGHITAELESGSEVSFSGEVALPGFSQFLASTAAVGVSVRVATADRPSREIALRMVQLIQRSVSGSLQITSIGSSGSPELVVGVTDREFDELVPWFTSSLIGPQVALAVSGTIARPLLLLRGEAIVTGPFTDALAAGVGLSHLDGDLVVQTLGDTGVTTVHARPTPPLAPAPTTTVISHTASGRPESVGPNAPRGSAGALGSANPSGTSATTVLEETPTIAPASVGQRSVVKQLPKPLVLSFLGAMLVLVFSLGRSGIGWLRAWKQG